MIFHDYLHKLVPHINRELKEFYAAIAIRGFAIYMIAIFEPIYIYNFFDGSLTKSFIYFGIISFFFGILAPFGAKLTTKIGIKHTILLSVPFLFLYYFGLWNIDKLGGYVYLLAILSVLDRLFYWPAYHIAFTRFSDHGKRGSEVGFRYIILSAVASIAPFIGGTIIYLYGFPALFMVVLAMLFASTIPLFMSQEFKEDYHDSMFEPFKQILSKRYRKKVFAFASQAGDLAIESFVWPIFLFTLAINFEELGIITSASLLFGMLFTFYIGRKTDKVGSERLLAVGSFWDAIVWPLKIFVNNPLTAFLTDTLHRFGRISAHIPFVTLFYDWAGRYKTSRDRLVILREMVLNVFRGIFLFILAFLFSKGFPLSYAFMLGPLFAFGMLAIIDKPKDLKEAS